MTANKVVIDLTWSLGQDLLALGNGQSTEADALIGVQHGGFAHQALDATHTTVHLEGGRVIALTISIYNCDRWFRDERNSSK